MRGNIAFAQVLLIVAGSTGCVQRLPEMTVPECIRRVAEHRTITREHDIISDSRLRTWAHVDELRKLIGNYYEEHGTVPRELSELTSLGSNLPSIWDGWGYAISYIRQGNDRYELRSAGSDGYYCTEDDFIATYESMPSYPTLPTPSPTGNQM